MSVEIRPVTESELPDWLRALAVGFLRPPLVTDEEVAARRDHFDMDRVLGAFDGDRCVATYRTFAQTVSVPGGVRLPSTAVTHVTVSPTHRRRGLLSGMMTAGLAGAKERGDAVATLIAAEYPIYGRFGFGPAAGITEWSVDVPRAGLDARRPVPDDGGRIDLVDGAGVRALGPALHERLAGLRHGVVSRSERWWGGATGSITTPPHSWTEPFHAVYRAADGEVEGLVTYTADDRWGDAKQPLNTATVRDLIAVTPRAERALWHFVCSVDWITTLRTGYRAPDDLLPDLLPDPRAARTVTNADFLWLRVLDTVRALEARTYEAPADLVLEVTDAAGLAGGRFRLRTERGGTACTPTADGPDLTLDVRELGALYLGGASAVRLAALGLVTEHRAGAVAEADTAFRTALRPWCPDTF